MDASRVKMYCDEIVISASIIRTVNLEMTLFEFSGNLSGEGTICQGNCYQGV